MDDFEVRLAAVLDSIRAHAAVLREEGDVAAAIRAFDEAAEAYEDLLADLGHEAPWDAEADDYDPDVPPPDAATDELVAVRARADFVVTDRDVFLASGTEARRRVWEDPAAPPCASLGEAFYELVHDAGPVLPMLDVPGLERRAALLVVHRTDGEAVGVRAWRWLTTRSSCSSSARPSASEHAPGGG